MIRHLLLTTSILASFMCAPAGAHATESDINPDDLINLSLEQLSNIEVTSVSKRSEKASEAAAAIFVVTQDDIRRSGAASIPDALRIVPGLSVAQSGSHQWAITSRGFGSQFANKLLVLIDGRSVYTPLFSGVYWDSQDLMLEDIDRIEVIRGPGATLWGTNAVNGVINIITKSAKNTQGNYAAISAGNQDNAILRARSGFKASDDSYVRTYAKFSDRNEARTMTGLGAQDTWNRAQSGFRSDGSSSESVSYTVQGDVFHEGRSFLLRLPTLTSPYVNQVDDRETVKGGNFLGRLSYRSSKDSDWTLQMYYDNVQRDNFVLNDTRNTLDMDLQQTWTGLAGHELVWGMGYRYIMDHTLGTFYDRLSPASRQDDLVSAFIQDKITLSPDDVFLTLGSKFERNDYTGFELQPSARLTWLIDNKRTWWASASHALRSPNRFSENGSLVLSVYPPSGPAAYVMTLPNPDAESEKLNAYETGIRFQAHESVSVDVSTFYNQYSKLFANQLGSVTSMTIPGYGTFLVLPITPINGNSGRTFGTEISTNWEVTDNWQVVAAYTFMDAKLYNPETAGLTTSGKAPEQQFNIHTSYQMPGNVELSGAIYYVDELKGIPVPDYLRLDLRMSWKPYDNLEVAIIGQNLLDDMHQEFAGFQYQAASQIPRAFYGNVAWKF